MAKDDQEEEEEERNKEARAEPVEEGEENLEKQLEHFRKEWRNELEKDILGNIRVKTNNDFSIEQQVRNGSGLFKHSEKAIVSHTYHGYTFWHDLALWSKIEKRVGKGDSCYKVSH